MILNKLPFENNHFAINGESRGRGVIDYGFKILSEIGICWSRIGGFGEWNDIEYKKGSYDWTIPDRYIKAAQKYQVNILPIIHPFTAWIKGI